jgi:hypothetical protein
MSALRDIKVNAYGVLLPMLKQKEDPYSFGQDSRE